MKKEKSEIARSWPQTWASYYGHITTSLNTEETHVTLAKERAIQHGIITRAEEHLKGVALYYKQAGITDPDTLRVSKKGHQCPSDSSGDTIANESSQNTPNSTRELSDREI